jgi:parallel beta-helix repeat protein
MNSLRLSLLSLALVGSALHAQDSGAPSRTSIAGTPAVSATLPPNRGGTVFPLPQAVFGREGTLAFKVAANGFASNGTLLDLGGNSPNRLVVSESWGSGPGPSRTGHFRLIVWDRQGRKAPVEGPMLKAVKPYLLVVSWKDDQYEFWVEGTSVGKVQCKALDGDIPDRLALVEPIGLRWQAIQVWSKQLTYAEVQSRTASQPWTFGADTTLQAVRVEGHETPQPISFGPGLMRPEEILTELTKPLARRSIVVDIANGNDQAAGDTEHPFKTIAHAASVAGPGDIVTVMPGTYRESIVLNRSGRANAPITFRASPTGPVTLDGTDPLSGLTSAGISGHVSLWVKTNFKTRDVKFGDPRTIEILTGRGPSGIAQLDRRGRVDTIWLDGQYVPKSAGRDSLKPRMFWVDKDKGELVLALDPGDRPDRHLLEIGARGPFFSGEVSYINIVGFHGIRSDEAYFAGAINPGNSSSDWIIDGFVESWGNWSGVLLHGFGHTVRNSITDFNGDDGIEGTLDEFITLENDKSRQNNWQPDRNINPSWGSGGSKFTQTDHMTVRNYDASFNHGPGIWFDENNAGIIIESSTFHYNGVGIMAEISNGPFLFRDNFCFDNAGGGIMVAESANAVIEHNTLVGNKYGIDLRNISNRTGAALAEGQTSFETRNVVIVGNVLAENQVGIANTFAGIDPARNNVKSDGNLFFKNGAMVLWPSKIGASTVRMDASNDWTPSEDGGGGMRMLTLDPVRKGLGFEKTSVSADPHFMMSEASDYQTDRQKAPANWPYGPREEPPPSYRSFLP